MYLQENLSDHRVFLYCPIHRRAGTCTTIEISARTDYRPKDMTRFSVTLLVKEL